MADPLLGRNPELVPAGPDIHRFDPLDAMMPLVKSVSSNELSPSPMADPLLGRNAELVPAGPSVGYDRLVEVGRLP